MLRRQSGKPEEKGRTQYLDSSALAKRYVEEKGSDQMDRIFGTAEEGKESLFFSAWNIGELAVVLDEYERERLLEAKPVMLTLLEEMKRLGKSRAAEMVPVSGSLMAQAVTLALKHHVYVADMLQLVSCRTMAGAGFVTADRRLASVAEGEGLGTTLVG